MEKDTAPIGVEHGDGQQVVHIDQDTSQKNQGVPYPVFLKEKHSHGYWDQKMDSIMDAEPKHR